MKRTLMLLVSILASVGIVVGFAPSAFADTNITVKASAHSTATDSVSNTAQTTVNGATQLLWEMSDHNIKVTMTQVRKAPHIKVSSCAKGTSAKIYKRTHKPIVVIKPGSCLKNQGRLGRIRGGFNFHVTQPTVLKFDKKINKYRHVFNVVGGRLDKTCGNIIGGHVDAFFPKVLQVRYQWQLQMQSTVSVHVESNATATASGTCPDGTVVNLSASGHASASASASVSYMMLFQSSVLNAKKSELESSLTANLEADAKADAMVQLEISCGTGTVQPPVIIDVTQVNDVDVTNTTEVCATVSLSGSNSGTLTFAARYGSFTTPKTFAVNGQVTKCATYMAPTEPPVPTGGKDTITYTVRDDTTGVTAVDSTTFTINPSPQPPL
jgi:hypothetical protein